ncbi:MAG: endo-1,4-beta-xylanase, partial [Bacteroidales bacterium]
MMKTSYMILRISILSLFMLITLFSAKSAETIEQWYANAQQRIDTLRKGTFGIKIYDKNGNPYAGNVSVRMQKHEYPFGIAFDLYENGVNYGNSYTTSASITAPADAEIYKSERWYSFISYAIPVEKNKTYKVTLKFAEIYFSNPGERIFDAYIEGDKVLSNFDIFTEAGGKNIAIDTSFYVTTSDSIINIELYASKDNAAIKGIEVQSTEDDWIKRINCGGGSITTSNGNFFESDTGYFNKNASRVPSDEDWMKAVMQKYFNYGVSGNSFKWSGIQPQHTAPNYTNFDNAVRFAKSVGWELKAHTLLWGGYDYSDDHALPRWVKDLPTAQAIYDTCKMRVEREMTRYKGIIKEYDVMNEPLHALYLASVVGDSINWNCFKWARAVDPDAKLIINDYNVEYNWGDAKKYRDLILKMKSMNIPVTGVGMQAHFWDGMRPNLVELVTNLNIVAEAGLPIKFTEFDNGVLSEEEQAKDVVLVTTIAFSHPMMNGMISWALWDKGAWREKSGYFTQNRRPKKAADTLLYLTKKLWATNFDTTYNGTNPLLFKAYYGTYAIEVKFGDTIKYFTIPCIQANKDSVFILSEQDALVKGPEVISSQLISNNSLEITFDKEINPESINTSDFKFFSDNPLRILSVKPDSNDKNKLIITLQNNITPNDYLTIYYFPGTLKGTDGSKVKTIGPLPLTNYTAGIIGASVVNNGVNVQVNFNTAMSNLLQNKDAFTINVNGIAQSISNIEYFGTDSSKALFTLSVPIKKGDKVTIKYTQGTLKPVRGFECASSPAMPVTNLWPSVVKAECDRKGTTISVTFNMLLQNVLSNAENFTIWANDQPISIKSIIETGKDSTIIKFILSDTIQKGQKVTLSYPAGNIQSINGNALASFDKIKVNYSSIVSGIQNINEDVALIFSNPANNYIKILAKSMIEMVCIFDIYGKLIYKAPCYSKNT